MKTIFAVLFIFLTVNTYAAKDYGDAPAIYTHVSHTITNDVYLGDIKPDAESDQQSSADASADDINGIDDEDGIIALKPLYIGSDNYDINVKVFNNSGKKAYITAWIDFDKDGTFQFREALNSNSLYVNSSPLPQIVNVKWDSSFSPKIKKVTKGETILRVRISTTRVLRCADEGTKNGNLSSAVYTDVSDGEVEDYLLFIRDKSDSNASYFNAWDENEDISNQVIHTKIAAEDITLNIASLNKDATAFSSNDAKEINASLFCENLNLMKKWTPVILPKDSTKVTFKAFDMKNRHFVCKDTRVVIRYSDQNSTIYEVNASNHFAIRPKSYKIELPSDLTAGEPFEATIKAIDANDTVIANYNEKADVYILDINETNSSKGCILGNISVKKADFKNGIAKVKIRYDEVGYLKLKIDEDKKNSKEFALIDQGDTPQRFIEKAEISSNEIKADSLELTWKLKNGGNGYTYFSSDPDIMGSSLQIKTSARNKMGTIVQNYTKSCYAKDVAVNIDYQIDQSLSKYKPIVKDLQENTYIDTSVNGKLKCDIKKNRFINGKANKIVKINFERKTNKALNPTLLEIKRLDAAISAKPLKKYTSTENNSTFIYVRAYVPDQMTAGKKMDATVYYETYCNGCDKVKYNLQNCKESVDNINWYQLNSIQSDPGFDYEIPHEITGGLTPTGTTLTSYYSIFSKLKKIDKRTIFIKVKKTPAKVRIDYIPESYLLFDPYNPTKSAHSFDAVFQDLPKKWAGKGETGLSVDMDISKRENGQKINW